MVSTDLKNMSQNGFIFPKVWGENKKSVSYHLVIFYPFPFYVIIACFFLRISPLSPRKPTIRTPNLQVLQQGLLFFGGRFKSSLFIQFMSWSMLCFQFWTPTTGTFINCWPVFSHWKNLTLESFFLVVEWGSCFPNVQETSETTGVCQPLGTKPGLSATTKIINTNCLLQILIRPTVACMIPPNLSNSRAYF